MRCPWVISFSYTLHLEKSQMNMNNIKAGRDKESEVIICLPWDLREQLPVTMDSTELEGPLV